MAKLSVRLQRCSSLTLAPGPRSLASSRPCLNALIEPSPSRGLLLLAAAASIDAKGALDLSIDRRGQLGRIQAYNWGRLPPLELLFRGRVSCSYDSTFGLEALDACWGFMLALTARDSHNIQRTGLSRPVSSSRPRWYVLSVLCVLDPGKPAHGYSHARPPNPRSPQRTISFLALAVPAAAFMAPAPMTERRYASP